MDKQKLLDIVALAESEHRSLTDEEKALINKAVEERACGEKPKEEKSCEGDQPCSGNTKDEKSPLTIRMNQFSKQICILVLCIAAVLLILLLSVLLVRVHI